MIEHEQSYVFTWDGAKKFFADQNIPWPENPKRIINDQYLSCGLRVRMSEDRHTAVITRKEGNKADGYRIEQEEEISWEAAQVLAEKAKLSISKKRYDVPVDTSKIGRPNDANMKVILDIVEKPMRLAVIEIEAMSESLYPLPADISRRVFGVELQPCPLSTFEYFMRKIGICGGPSSGKSETASVIAHRVNTEFGGNAFHVAEFATTFIQKYHRTPTFQDQFFIWHGQHEREEDADSAGIVVSDCPSFLAYIYLMYLNREKFSPQVALYCAKMYKRALFDIESYSNLVFLSLQDYVDNNVRYQSKAEAAEIEGRIKQFLDDHHIPHIPSTCYDMDEIFNKLFWINVNPGAGGKL
jgi:nicotinamide riboside kinase